MINKQFLEEYKKIPDVLFEVEKNLFSREMQMEKVLMRLEARKGAIFADITTQKTPEGKLMYTNEKAREYALKHLLQEDEKYDDILESWSTLKNIIEDLKREQKRLTLVLKTRTELLRHDSATATEITRFEYQE